MWLLAFGLLAAADWAAVARGHRAAEFVAKPGALLALLGYAWTGEQPSSWLLAALVFSLAGDVFLLAALDWFFAGLASFLLAHLCYVAAFPAALPTRLAFTGFAAALLAPVAARILRSLAATLGSAAASGRAAGMFGAALFVVSDGLLAWTRFVEAKRWAPVAVIVTYHCGQLVLVTALRCG